MNNQLALLRRLLKTVRSEKTLKNLLVKGVDYVLYNFGGIFGGNLFIIIQTLLGADEIQIKFTQGAKLGDRRR